MNARLCDSLIVRLCDYELDINILLFAVLLKRIQYNYWDKKGGDIVILKDIYNSCMKETDNFY